MKLRGRVSREWKGMFPHLELRWERASQKATPGIFNLEFKRFMNHTVSHYVEGQRNQLYFLCGKGV